MSARKKACRLFIAKDTPMKQKTSIGKSLDISGAKSKYDAEVKKLLANKTILAWIMQYTVEEFAGYSIEEIHDCIEGTPQIASVPVEPGYISDTITGIFNEDNVPNEGIITYDIRFYALTRKGERVKLILNVEAQKKLNVGYDIITRAIFYCARMLSSQLGTEFDHQHYNDIKKVYSIWLCIDVPQYAEYTITRYKMKKDDLHGHNPKEYRYDLLEAVMICLGRETEQHNGNRLHGMLSTMLSDKLTPQEKEAILQNEYNIETTIEMEGELQQMCNLSDLIEEKALAQGIEQGIEQGEISMLVSLVQDGTISIEVAATRLKITPEEFQALMNK